MILGFDRNSHVFYEGFSGLRGATSINPSVVFTQAALIPSSPGGSIDLGEGVWPDEYKMLFREDSFDPVTKVRRGRFYKPDLSKSNPTPEMVSPLPGLEVSLSNERSELLVRKSLRIFSKASLRNEYPRPSAWPLVALGWKSTPTFWRILQIENISTGEELVYLRSRNSIGMLPEIDFDKERISSEDQGEIKAKYMALSNDLHSSTAESIVDHCRDVAEVILRSKIRQRDSAYRGGELDMLTRKFLDLYNNEFRLIAHYSQIIRQFHQRRKTALKDQLDIRSITEEDAELAVSCVSSMVRDLGLEKLN